MRPCRLTTALIAVLVFTPLDVVRAQEPDSGDTTQHSRPRIGLVLSGGGARGLAHIGVLRALEAEGIIPDVVTGASMGALVGGLYAIGYSPSVLDSLVTSLEWRSLFLDAPERRFLSLDQRFSGERTILDLPVQGWKLMLPTGVISGQRISELLVRLTWPVRNERDFRRFPRAFAATATDIVTGETVVLDSGSLAEALRASMSIPSLFAPARLNGRLLIDGGVTRNLPARDARALGAEVLICSDVSSPLYPAERMRSLLDVLMQTITIYMQTTAASERELCDVYIRPNTTGLTAADFDRAEVMIERGAEAASEAHEELREIAGRADRSPALYLGAMEHDSVCITSVGVERVGGAASLAIRHRLRLPVPGCVTAGMLHEAVQRVYATELFDHVGYRFEERDADTAVIISASAREQDRVGLGLRYDDASGAGLLFTVRLRNRIGFGSSTHFDLRLGEQLRIALRHANLGFARSHLMIGASASYSRTPMPVFDRGLRIASARIEVRNATVLGGVLLGDQGAFGLEVKGERAEASVPIASGDSAGVRSYATAAVVLRWNSLDHPTFPSRGVVLSVRGERAFDAPRFSQYVGSATIAVPVGGRVTALGRATVGHSSPEPALPLHYWFTLGGSYPAPLFPETQVSHVGLHARSRSGSTVSRFGTALQWEVRADVFASIRADIGQVGPSLTFDRGAYDAGLSIAVGASTPLGPIEFALSGQPGNGRPRLEANLGYAF